MLEPFQPSFFRRLQQLKIHTRRAFLGSRQGIHRSSRRGHGLEFADFRAYAPGDDFRHIDWGVLARTDRLYVRQFREEQDLSVSVLLDASESMAWPESEDKFEKASQLSLALAYIALTDGDPVTLCKLGEPPSPRFRGPKALSRARAYLNESTPAGELAFADSVRAAIARQRTPGKVFVLSDFMFDPEEQHAGLDALRYRNFDITVLQILAPSELRLGYDPGSLEVRDSETGERIDLALSGISKKEYAKVLAEHVAQLEQYCQKYGIRHVLVSSEESLSDIILTRMPAMGILG